MHGIEFTADFFLMPLKGCDMVLGVQWFTSLGKVLFDFSNHTIGFEIQGRKVLLKGVPDKNIRTVGIRQIDRAMNEGVQLGMATGPV